MNIYTPFKGDSGNAHYWRMAAHKIGASLVYSPSKYVLPLSDFSAVEISKMKDVLYMSEASLEKITDRIQQQTLGIPVIPAIVPLSISDLEKIDQGPVFVKHRKTYIKRPDKFNYTMWNSVPELISAIDQDFWNTQTNPDILGEYVVQPLVSYPHDNYMLSVSVNEASEPLIYMSSFMTYIAPEVYYNMYSPAVVFQQIIDSITKVCKDLRIKGGIHEIEFIKYKDNWCLMDWNPRPSVGTTLGRNSTSGVMERALAHMVGLPLPQQKPFYSEQHIVVDRGLGTHEADIAKSLGMHVRMQNKSLIKAIAYEDENKQKVLDKFNEFENSIK